MVPFRTSEGAEVVDVKHKLGLVTVADVTPSSKRRSHGPRPAGPGLKSGLASWRVAGSLVSGRCTSEELSSTSGVRSCEADTADRANGETDPGVRVAGTTAVAVWSWDEVVKTHWSSVLRTAFSLTDNRHDAEDLTQEVFLSVFRCLSTYTTTSFEHRLRSVTVALHRARIRHDRDLSLVTSVGKAGNLLATTQSTDESALNGRALSLDVRSALSNLTPDLRAAIVLSDIDALSCGEVASRLGVDWNVARDRIHKARLQLRIALAHRAPSRLESALVVTSEGS
jgi:RNA polymerase sigma factor (sigma-70 family)